MRERRRFSPGVPAATRPRLLLALVALAIVLCACAATVLANHTIGPWLAQSDTQQPAASGSAATATGTVTGTQAPTPTDVSQSEQLAHLLSTQHSLRGRYIGLDDPNFADPILVVFIQESTPPTLADAQSDAYSIQRLIWGDGQPMLSANWEVSVEFYINSTFNQMGTYVGTANLKGTRASAFNWAQLSPQQAWQRYDGTAFNPRGL